MEHGVVVVVYITLMQTL